MRDRTWCCVGPMLLVGAVIGVIGSQAGNALATAGVAKLLGDMSYHQSADLAAAADRMIRDALALGLDIDAVESDGRATSLADTVNGLLRVEIGWLAVDLPMRGRSYAERLMLGSAPDDTARFVAILVADRGLSIAEMAELLRADVRVLDKCGRNVFILRAPVAALALLDRMSYCRRLEALTPAMKRTPDWSASAYGYDLYYFGSEREHAMRVNDIENLGLECRGGYPPMRGLAVRGPWERVQLLLDLWWVRIIIPYRPPAIVD